jgi:hypothetical protein
MRLLIKYPTRQRPQQFITTLWEYVSKLDDPAMCHIIVSADLTDHTMRQPLVLKAVRECSVSIEINYGRNTSKVEAINADMHNSGQWDVLLLASDDMIPQVQGYDTAIKQAFETDPGAIWMWDGRQDRINTIQCLSRHEYERLGYIYHPSYRSLWCDNEATDVGLRDGRLSRVPGLIIKNESPDWGGSQKRDRLYRVNNSWYEKDRINYERRKAAGFP